MKMEIKPNVPKYCGGRQMMPDSSMVVDCREGGHRQWKEIPSVI